jgi:hypothetical protein
MIMFVGTFVELNTWIAMVYAITMFRLFADALEIIRGH